VTGRTRPAGPGRRRGRPRRRFALGEAAPGSRGAMIAGIVAPAVLQVLRARLLARRPR